MGPRTTHAGTGRNIVVSLSIAILATSCGEDPGPLPGSNSPDPGGPAGPVWFEEAAGEAGLDFTHDLRP